MLGEKRTGKWKKSPMTVAARLLNGESRVTTRHDNGDTPQRTGDTPFGGSLDGQFEQGRYRNIISKSWSIPGDSIRSERTEEAKSEGLWVGADRMHMLVRTTKG